MWAGFCGVELGLADGVVEETQLFKRNHGDNASFRVNLAVEEILSSFWELMQRRRKAKGERDRDQDQKAGNV